MFFQKEKRYLPWCLGISFAEICFLMVFPVLLFMYFPYSLLFMILYSVLATLFTLLYYKLKKPVCKIIAFVLFSFAAVVRFPVLILIQSGVIVYPP